MCSLTTDEKCRETLEAEAATATAPDRSLPAGMAKLLRLALETGLDFVELGFEGLGGNVPASIGWLLHLGRVDPMMVDETDDSPASHTNFLTVSAQIGSDISAYVGPVDGEDPYLNEDQITAWIHAARTGIPEYTAEEKTALAADTQRFLDAVAHGWAASRELRRHELAMLNKHFETEVSDMVTVVKFSALNWFYNIEGHPGHRDNDTAISEELVMISSGITAEAPYYCGIGAYESDAATILAKVAAPQPWFAPVAYFDDESEEWVL